jgi:rhodanese-related sulfurtransferase
MSTVEILPADFLRKVKGHPNCLVVDVRTPAEYASEHFPGSINLPLDQLQGDACVHLADQAKGKELFLVCRTGKRASMARENIENQEGCNPVVVAGGISAMNEHGAALNSGDRQVISLERQVRIAAGGLVLIGAVLAATVNPAFVALSAFVGAGLMFAGITDTCGMAMALGKMPWNQVKA